MKCVYDDLALLEVVCSRRSSGEEALYYMLVGISNYRYERGKRPAEFNEFNNEG